MPDSYMLNVRMRVSNVLDCIFQPMRETLLVGFEIGPSSIELVSTIIVLSCSVISLENVDIFCKNLQETANCRR